MRLAPAVLPLLLLGPAAPARAQQALPFSDGRWKLEGPSISTGPSSWTSSSPGGAASSTWPFASKATGSRRRST
jgi:hypothetical protein